MHYTLDQIKDIKNSAKLVKRHPSEEVVLNYEWLKIINNLCKMAKKSLKNN